MRRSTAGIVLLSYLVVSRSSMADDFVRGDADGNGAINITDPIQILQYSFLGGAEPRCLDAVDIDDSGSITITDPIYLLNFLFQGGAPPPPPSSTMTRYAKDDCGTDPTGDPLGCAVFLPCRSDVSNAPRPNEGVGGQEPCLDDLDGPSVMSYPARHGAVLNTGEARLVRADLVIPGRGQVHFAMVRSYRSRLSYDGPLGHGWDFHYGERLFEEPNGDVVRLNGRGHVDRWMRSPDGSYVPPRGFFGMLILGSDGSFVYREPDGFQRIFDAAGRLRERRDRFGNRMRFEYDASGNLSRVFDAYDRVIEFFFAEDPGGKARLVRIRDFAGREVEYAYDANGDLIAVTSPAVTGTSIGNDFPEGRTERYEYTSGLADPRLDHNLLSVTAPEEVVVGGPPFLVCTYGTDANDAVSFDRLLSVELGGTNASDLEAGGTVRYRYVALDTQAPAGDLSLPRLGVEVTERNGNRFDAFFNELGQEILHRRLTRGLRPDEPPAYERISEYSEDGLLLRRVFPEGNSISTTYASGGPRSSRRNPVEVRLIADPTRGGGEDLVITATYEPLFNQLRTVTDPRGNSETFTPPIPSVNPDRYTTQFFYDYQEGNAPVPEAERFGIDLQGVPRSLGDLNGDGGTDQAIGRVVRKLDPTVNLLVSSNEAARRGTTLQEIITEYSWNDRGQILARIDAEGNVDRFEYFPENDPDGDGTVVPGATSNALAGYLHVSTVDAAPASPRRSAVAPPAELATTYGYDAVGNVIRRTNPRGVEMRWEVNQLDEVVVVVRGAETSEAISRGQLPTAEAPFRYSTRIRRDHNGRTTRIEVENRDTTNTGLGDFVELEYQYDILGNVLSRSVEVEANEFVTWEVRYDPNELPVSLREPEGNERRVQYDERSLPFILTLGAGTPQASSVQIDYDRNSNPARFSDGEDHDGDARPETTVFVYDGFDRRTRVIDAIGNELIVTYDVASNPISAEAHGHPAGRSNDPNVLLAREIRHHDELNRVYQVDQSLFLAEGFAPVRPIELRDGNSDGLVTTFLEYDALSRSTFRVEDDNQIARTVYDGAGRAVEESDAHGNRWEVTYDRSSNPVSVRSREVSPEGLVPPESYVTFYVWDQLDRLARVSASHTQRFSYDSRDNMVAQSDAEGPLTTDPIGIDPLETNAPGNTISLIYDGRGLPTSVVRDLRQGAQGGQPLDLSNPFNPDGRVRVEYEYDRNGRLVALVDDNGNRTAFEFDALNRITRRVHADLTFESCEYDRDHNPVRIVDARGVVTRNTYDALGRLVERTVSPAGGTEGTLSAVYAYDGLSRLTAATDDNGSAPSHQIERVYDSLSRILEERQDGKVISSTWSGDGRRLSVTYPGGRSLAFNYDRIDRLERISEDEQLIANYDWIGPDQRRFLQRSHGNGTRMTFLDDTNAKNVGWDAFKRAALIRHMRGSEPLVARVQDYNRENHLLFEERLDQGGARDAFSYDSIYRVVASMYDRLVGSAPRRELEESLFTYDGTGNRREVEETRSGVGAVTSYAVNAVNEYTQVGAFAREHDDEGNLTDDGTLRYVFDYRDRLVRIARKSDGAPVAAYEYDALDRRVQKTVFDPQNPGAVLRVSRHLYDGWRVVEENDAAGRTAATYVFGVGIDEPIQMRTTAFSPAGEGTYYYHQNARGDVAALTNAQGEVVERTVYETFGAPNLLSGVGNPYLFQGVRLDEESGLYYFRHRMYDPRAGRFLSRDPMGDPASLGNQYSFAGNDPVSRGDPLGLFEIKAGSFVGLSNKSLEADACVVVGVGKALSGIGELMSFVVGGTAQWCGLNPKGYFGDAMRKADLLAEGMVALVDDPSVVVTAPLRQFDKAIERGDAWTAGEVFGQMSFDVVTTDDGVLEMAQTGVRPSRQARENASETHVRVSAAELARFEEEMAARTLRRCLVDSRKRLNSPVIIYEGGDLIPEQTFEILDDGIFVMTGRGVVTDANPASLSEDFKVLAELPWGRIDPDSAWRPYVLQGTIDWNSSPIPIPIESWQVQGHYSLARAAEEAIPEAEPDTFVVQPNVQTVLTVSANDGGPAGGEYVLVSGPTPALPPGAFDWRGNGTFTITIPEGEFSLTYRRELFARESEDVDVTITSIPLFDLPTGVFPTAPLSKPDGLFLLDDKFAHTDSPLTILIGGTEGVVGYDLTTGSKVFDMTFGSPLGTLGFNLLGVQPISLPDPGPQTNAALLGLGNSQTALRNFLNGSWGLTQIGFQPTIDASTGGLGLVSREMVTVSPTLGVQFVTFDDGLGAFAYSTESIPRFAIQGEPRSAVLPVDEPGSPVIFLTAGTDGGTTSTVWVHEREPGGSPTKLFSFPDPDGRRLRCLSQDDAPEELDGRIPCLATGFSGTARYFLVDPADPTGETVIEVVEVGAGAVGVQFGQRAGGDPWAVVSNFSEGSYTVILINEEGEITGTQTLPLPEGCEDSAHAVPVSYSGKNYIVGSCFGSNSYFVVPFEGE